MDPLIDEIFRRYDALRYRNERLRQERTGEIHRRIPAVADLAAQVDALRASLFQNALNPGFDFNEAQAVVDGLLLQKRATLAAHGYPENYLDPIYSCDICHDTGIDPGRNTRCTCFEQALRAEKYYETGLPDDGASFEKFDLSVFPNDEKVCLDGNVRLDLTQRQYMDRLRKIFLKYAEVYPKTNKNNVLFTGASGLGKTYLLKCVANRIIERGFSCLFITSYRLFDMLKKNFLGEQDDIRDLYELSLLIIDDLGTEPVMKNITSESFFTLIAERMGRKLHTLIATNLSPAELQDRYGERIYSRLLSAADTDVIKFDGQDLRLQIKK